MENSIKIWMGLQDADEVQKIFDRIEDPGFIILNRYQMKEYPDNIQLELICNSTLRLWYLAKEVEMHQAFERRIKEIMDKTREIQAASLKNIQSQLNALKNDDRKGELPKDIQLG